MVSLKISDLRKTFFTPTKLSHPIEKYAPGQGLEDVYLNVFGEGDGK